MASDATIADLVELAAHACDCPIAWLALVDDERLELAAAVGVTARELPRDGAFCLQAIACGELFVVPDARADERWQNGPLVAAEPFVRFYAGVPLVTPDGRPLGALAVADRRPRQLAGPERFALGMLGRAAAARLELQRLLAASARARGAAAADWDALPFAVAFVDSDGRVTRANHQLLALVGATERELAGRALAALVGGDAARQLVDGREPRASGIECRLERKDGERIAVVAQRGRHALSDRPREAIVAFTVDGGAAAGRRRAEAALGARVDELRRSQDLLAHERASRTMLEAALRGAGMAAWCRDLGSGVIRWQGAVDRVLHIAADAVPRTFDELIALMHGEDVRAFSDEIQRARRERTSFCARFRVIGSDGAARWIEARGTYSSDDAGQPIRAAGLLQDVTAQHEAEERARRAGRRIRDILGSVTDGFVALDRDWKYTYANRHAAEMFHRDPESLIGKHIWTEFPEGVGQPFQRAYERAMAEQVPIAMEGYYAPWQRWFENRIYPSSDGDGVSIFFTEITARKRAEEERRRLSDRLRALSTRLQLMREQENSRLAREIHDEMGQALTAAKMDLVWIARRLATPPQDPEARARLDAVVGAKLDEMRELVDGAIGAVRRISSELRPAILDELGLSATLRWYSDDFGRRSGIACALHDEAVEEQPSREVATALFRTFQDALTNVARHSGATHVDATLSRQDGTLQLVVEDDGSGFDPAAASDPRSIGLLGMQERAAAVGGCVTFAARHGGGTRVTIEAPLDDQDADQPRV